MVPMNVAPAGRCPKCNLLTDHVTGPGNPRPCPYDRLRAALGNVEPSSAEDRSLHWLAGVDGTTIDALESLFEKLRRETI